MVAAVKPVSFRLTPEERRELEHAAEARESTVSKVARDRYLAGTTSEGAGAGKKGSGKKGTNG